MRRGDVLLVTELSRVGRNLMQIMSILNQCMERDIQVFTTNEGYELGNNINAKILAFAFGLSAEIERNLISRNAQRRRWPVKRPKGWCSAAPRAASRSARSSLAKTTKFSGYLPRKFPLAASAGC